MKVINLNDPKASDFGAVDEDVANFSKSKVGMIMNHAHDTADQYI